MQTTGRIDTLAEVVMKIVAMNGSPKMGEGLTAAVLNPFLDGMEAAGAQVSRYATSAMSIEPCQGCFSCSINQTGICWQKDDLTNIYAEVVDADVWVFATPVYVSGMTGPLKTFIDRLLISCHERRCEARESDSCLQLRLLGDGQLRPAYLPIRCPVRTC